MKLEDCNETLIGKTVKLCSFDEAVKREEEFERLHGKEMVTYRIPAAWGIMKDVYPESILVSKVFQKPDEGLSYAVADVPGSNKYGVIPGLSFPHIFLESVVE